MAGTKRTVVAQIHAHFNIMRPQKEPIQGEVTREEQIAALDRFVRWHERQVTIGRQLLSAISQADEPAETERQAHSLSEYRRLTAQGVDVKPPGETV